MCYRACRRQGRTRPLSKEQARLPKKIPRTMYPRHNRNVSPSAVGHGPSLTGPTAGGQRPLAAKYAANSDSANGAWAVEDSGDVQYGRPCGLTVTPRPERKLTIHPLTAGAKQPSHPPAAIVIRGLLKMPRSQGLQQVVGIDLNWDVG